MKQIKNNIDKNFILNNVDQIQIFARYFNIKESDIENCIINNSLIHSPIRIDDRPSVGFRYNNKGRLKMRDFGGFFWGDCFDAVAYVLSSKSSKIDINNAANFKYILTHIASEFNIINGVSNDDDIIRLATIAKKSKKIITFEPRNWDNNDKRIWIDKYHNLFTFDYLDKSYIYPVELFWIDSYSQPEPKYYYTRKDPCYAYYLGQDDDNLPNIRLYFPNRKNDLRRPKFISNNNSFQGVLDINGKYDVIVLTKSYKDVVALRRLNESLFFTGNLRILFIAYPSENFILTNDIVNWLLDRLYEPDVNNIINFLDFDRTGRRSAYYCYNEFNIPFVFLTNGEFGLDNHGAKDITDFIEKYGINATVTIINEFIKNRYGRYDKDIEGASYYNEETSPF